MEKFSKQDLIRIYNYTDHPFTNYSDWLEDLLLEQLNRIQDLQTKHLESLAKANAARQGHLFQGEEFRKSISSFVDRMNENWENEMKKNDTNL